ncbi:YHS domain-containing protein [Raineyella antarctica]|uniref:YHS domain-containing protein n=1 Tax=Raineyella antarctica TaxID=1577474 RepID=A0A1G6I218_9ACTN|nr:YHS domain-containing protein [Raineyella antarctica]SDB99776.1 YHS domain-containing protein [Raineyella antarctica]
MRTQGSDLTGRSRRDARERAGRRAGPGAPVPGPVGPADRLVTCTIRDSPTVRSRAEADGHVRVRAGRRYYFCCSDCAALFDADPLAYVLTA